MPTHHATLGPSGASRWLRCPASIRMSQKVPKQGSSPFALEGTIAHELGEIRASAHFGLITEEELAQRMREWDKLFQDTYGNDEPRRAEMNSHIDGYIKLIAERMAISPHSQVLFEQRLETGVPGCWGTSDVVIFSPDHVEIIDLKYGSGVPVSATWNPQLMLYGVGALDAYGDILGDTDTVFTTIYQPRLDNTSIFEISAADLRAWRDWHVTPLAREALEDPDARFGPSATACRWCPAAGICGPRMAHNTSQDFMDQEDIGTITPEKMADVLRAAPEFKAWLSAVENAALDRAYSQNKPVPGFKVVRSGGRRAIPAGVQAAAVQELIDAGFSAESVAQFKTRGLGELEKIVGGRKNLDQLIGHRIEKSVGKPSLVPEDDKRAAISPEASAAADFS